MPPINKLLQPKTAHPSQWDTPEFQHWFSGSQIADSQGNPLKLYHGTNMGPQETGVFEAGRSGYIYTTPDPQYAEGYGYGEGHQIYPLYARATKPLDLRPLGLNSYKTAFNRACQEAGINFTATGSAISDPTFVWVKSEGFKEACEAAGYDAIWLRERDATRRADALLLFDPKQLKSASGNRGTFNTEDPRVTASAKYAAPIDVPKDLVVHLTEAVITLVRKGGGDVQTPSASVWPPLSLLDRVRVWVEQGKEVASVSEAYFSVADRMIFMELTGDTNLDPAITTADVTDTLVHELAHAFQAYKQGTEAFVQNHQRDILESEGDNHEIKALSAEICATYKQALGNNPHLSIKEFLSNDWRWKQIQGKAPTRSLQYLYRDLAATQRDCRTTSDTQGARRYTSSERHAQLPLEPRLVEGSVCRHPGGSSTSQQAGKRVTLGPQQTSDRSTPCSGDCRIASEAQGTQRSPWQKRCSRMHVEQQRLGANPRDFAITQQDGRTAGRPDTGGEEIVKKAQLLQKQAGQLVLWHGGNLEDAFDETMAHKKGRWEYGPGLYLTTHYGTAQKYAKGSRKLYRITISQGNDAWKTCLDWDTAVSFIKDNAIRAKQGLILERLSRYKESGLRAAYLINNLMNEEALASSKSGILRKFLVDNGVDYEIVDNAFGWGERMVVLYNMKKILKKEIIRAKDPIDTFDLPTEFSGEDKLAQGKNSALVYPPTSKWIRLAKNFFMDKWRERAKETGRSIPTDLSGACKFGSLFAQAVFGGTLQGNYNHQFVVLDNGIRIDLGEDAQDRLSFSDDGEWYNHDDAFFNNPEHLESMTSCKPRVQRWVKEWTSLHPLTSNPKQAGRQEQDHATNMAKRLKAMGVQFRVNEASTGTVYLNVQKGDRQLRVRFSDHLPPASTPSDLAKARQVDIQVGPQGVSWDEAWSQVQAWLELQSAQPHVASHQDVIQALQALPFSDKLWVFGSRARGDYHEHSDVDAYYDARPLTWAEWCDSPESKALLDIARQHYGGFDPFVLIASSKPGLSQLLVRNDRATGWTGSCNSKEMLAQIKKDRKKIVELPTGDTLISQTKSASIYDGYCPICGSPWCSGECAPRKRPAKKRFTARLLKKQAKPIQVPSRLVDALTDDVRYTLEMHTADLAATQTPLTWTWDITGRIIHWLPDLPTSPFYLRVVIDTPTGDTAQVVPHVSSAGYYPWIPGIQLQIGQVAYEDLGNLPPFLIADIKRALTHELSHAYQAGKQGLDRFIKHLERPYDHKTISDGYESKALSAELCDTYLRALRLNPNLTVEEFISHDYVWKDVKQRVTYTERSRILRDLAWVFHNFKHPKRPTAASLESSRKGAAPVDKSQQPDLEGPSSRSRIAAVVFHGTTKEFGEFKDDYINTGEGNQTYGWGHYFAEVKSTADYYRKSLSNSSTDGKYVWHGVDYKSRSGPEVHALSLAYWENVATARRIAREGVQDAKAGKPYAVERGLDYWEKMLEVANQIHSKSEIKMLQGLLYEVTIPDGPYLLWEKPFSAQPEEVKVALRKWIELGDIPERALADFDVTTREALAHKLFRYDGKEIYFDIAEIYASEKLASRALREFGIMGVKYRDQGTRNSETGATYNYVLFKGADAKIRKTSSLLAKVQS